MKNKVNSKLEWIRNFFFDSRKDGADRIVMCPPSSRQAKKQKEYVN